MLTLCLSPKDDALHFPTVRQRTYPQPCMENMNIYTHFTRTADEVGPSACGSILFSRGSLTFTLQVLLTLMDALEGPLGLPVGTLRKLHPDDQLSGSETRVIRKPAEGETGYVGEGKKGGVQGASIGAHTDFGSCELTCTDLWSGCSSLDR